MLSDITNHLHHLYRQWSGREPEWVEPFPAHGSKRRYYRIHCKGRSVIGAYNEDRRENIAFLTLSRHFRRHGLPVPEIYADDLENGVCLEQDLGDETLFSILEKRREADFSDDLTGMYRQALSILPRFQITAGRDLDYAVCYPREAFDAQSIRWDLNYFKYHFLKLADIPFDEQALEDDFVRLTDFLLQADTNYFLYRDFQSRNILWFEDRLWFIDYQGGRRGALQYDVASLLMGGKADLPWPVRDALLDHYLETLGGYISVDREAFLHYYYGYALIRVMQAFGAYGFRGLHEGKAHFLRSIPYALDNLEGLMKRAALPAELPALTDAWTRMLASEPLRRLGRVSGPGLTVHIRSFAYKEGLPRDETGHGGGFVFDCRVLPNPGRNPVYAQLTGRDAPVIDYLEKDEDVQQFLARALALIDQAVAHHRRRGFTDLTVAFGCTGGQHRSVFFAARLAAHLAAQDGVHIDLQHREL